MLKFLGKPKVLLPFIAMVGVLTLFMPRTGEFEYHYRKGGKWNYETLVAPFSFPILKTPEQIQQEKERLGSTYVPYYKYSEDVYDQVCASIALSLEEENPAICHSVCEALKPYYNRGVLPDSQTALGVDADESQEVIFIQKDKRARKLPKDEVYSLAFVRNRLPVILQKDYPAVNLDSVFAKHAVYVSMQPNLIFDKQTTEMVHQESAEFISPTSGTFHAGDIIVNSDEIITADIAQLLDSFKAEFEVSVGYNGPNWLLWFGNFAISFILGMLVFTLIYYIREKTFSSLNELLFIITLFVVACLVTFLFSRLPSQLCYMVPYPVFALFYKGFFRKRLVLPLYVVCLIPLLICMQEGAQLFVVFLFSGFVAVYAFEIFSVGWKQFISASIIFAASIFAYLTFRILNGTVQSVGFVEIGYFALGSLFCVLAYPLAYLFEMLFNLMSANRLVELTDTSRTLLRELADKAPGTFQHSLAVMNMADAAARSIDADIPLIRAAALYHDVGKIMNPLCFIENQPQGVKYHENLTPQESAADIIRHVTDGVTICEKYGVPAVIRDFVLSHHGTTTAGYFWTKYLNEGGDPSNEALFTYPGPKPVSKEEAILMLCDTLEAASRTLNDFSVQKVDNFVEDVYNKKLSAGQFDQSDMTLGELETVKHTLKNYIVQIHHGRIAYPKRKK